MAVGHLRERKLRAQFQQKLHMPEVGQHRVLLLPVIVNVLGAKIEVQQAPQVPEFQGSQQLAADAPDLFDRQGPALIQETRQRGRVQELLCHVDTLADAEDVQRVGKADVGEAGDHGGQAFEVKVGGNALGRSEAVAGDLPQRRLLAGGQVSQEGPAVSAGAELPLDLVGSDGARRLGHQSHLRTRTRML